MKQTLDARLSAAAAFVRPKAVFADVGTDHAYLPLYLLSTGRITRAYVTDIHPGPLARARENAAACGLSDRVEAVLCDGLTDLAGCGLQDIAICGMGGEMIVHILEEAPFVRDAAVRLILQPMTRAAVLRRYLAENGYMWDGETLCAAAGRVYTCFAVHYTGVPHTLSPCEAEIGVPRVQTEQEISMFVTYISKKVDICKKRLRGLRCTGDAAAAREEEALLAALLQIKEAYCHDGT